MMEKTNNLQGWTGADGSPKRAGVITTTPGSGVCSNFICEPAVEPIFIFIPLRQLIPVRFWGITDQ